MNKPKPSYAEMPELWDPPSAEMQKGLELAAYICRMYRDGDRWAEAILSRAEQVRARFHMAMEGEFL